MPSSGSGCLSLEGDPGNLGGPTPLPHDAGWWVVPGRVYWPHLGQAENFPDGNPLQRSCRENPRDGGAWWAAVFGVAQSRTRLKRYFSCTSPSGQLPDPGTPAPVPYTGTALRNRPFSQVQGGGRPTQKAGFPPGNPPNPLVCFGSRFSYSSLHHPPSQDRRELRCSPPKGRMESGVGQAPATAPSCGSGCRCSWPARRLRANPAQSGASPTSPAHEEPSRVAQGLASSCTGVIRLQPKKLLVSRHLQRAGWIPRKLALHPR